MLNEKESFSEEQVAVLTLEEDEDFTDFEEEILDDLEDDIDYDEEMWEDYQGREDEI